MKHNKQFEIYYKQYYSQLCGYAYTYLNNYDNAEEIVEETFYNLYNKNNFKDIKSIKSYLFKMVYNNCINFINHKKIKDNYISTEIKLQNEEYSYIDLSSLDKSSEVNILDEINKSIEKLPEQCKKIFILKKMDQLSHNEISKKLNISKKTIENQITKANRLLRVDLKWLIGKVMIISTVASFIKGNF